MQSSEALEKSRGTYVLVLHLSTAAILEIGRLGTAVFPSGWYTYAGSAHGPGGLRGRLKHHLGAVQRPHWHVDYLRQAACSDMIWYVTSDALLEHTWAAALSQMPGASVPLHRFGASDCHCASHLFHFAAQPDFNLFCSAVSSSAPDAIKALRVGVS